MSVFTWTSLIAPQLVTHGLHGAQTSSPLCILGYSGQTMNFSAPYFFTWKMGIVTW